MEKFYKMKAIKYDIKLAFRIYTLTLPIPITLTVMNILCVGILGFETKLGFLMNFKAIWFDYYFSGSFLNVAAWVWQIVFLVGSFLLAKFKK